MQTKSTLHRTVRIAAVGLALAGAVVGLAGFGFHGHCHGQKFFRRMVDACVEELLDKLDANPTQRQQVATVEERLLGDMKAMRESHRGLVDQLVLQLPNERLDMQAIDQASEPQKQAMEKLHQDLRQAVQDVHAILTPKQRQKLADLIKEETGRCDQK